MIKKYLYDKETGKSLLITPENKDRARRAYQANREKYSLETEGHKGVESPEGYKELESSLMSDEQIKPASLTEGMRVPMRGVVAGAEAAKDWLGGGATKAYKQGDSQIDKLGELFQESYNTPEEEKGFVRQTLEAPEFIPTMAFPYSKASGIIGKLGGVMGKKVPQAIMKGGAEGLIEEGIRGSFNEFDPKNLMLGAGVGGAFGLGGDLLGGLAYDKFKNLPTNRAFPEMTDLKKEMVTKETYENLPGVVDYNLPKRMKQIDAEKSRLGKIKEQGILEAQNVAGELPQVQYSAIKGADKQIIDETKRVSDLIQSGDMTQNQAIEYLGYIGNLEDQYLKEGAIPFEKLPSTIESALDALGQSVPKESVTDLNKLFKLRKTLDSEYAKEIKKSAGGAQNVTKNEAVMFTRGVLNDRIDMIIDETKGELERRIRQGVADKNTYKSIEALSKIESSLEEAKGLPSLYRQKQVVKNIGGGRVQKSSPYGIGSSGLMSLPGAKVVLPPSGIRERQLGRALRSQPLQSLGKDYIYREQNLIDSLGGQ